MNKDKLAKNCVEAMIKKDGCTKKMGMNIVEVSYDHITVEMVVTSDMLNGFYTCHGGQIFTLADSIFAFACNTRNEVTVAAGGDINFINAAYCDDKLTARSKRVKHSAAWVFMVLRLSTKRVS